MLPQVWQLQLANLSESERDPRGPERKSKTGQDERRRKTGKTDVEIETETGKTEGKTGGSQLRQQFQDCWEVLHSTGSLQRHQQVCKFIIFLYKGQ